MSSFMVSDTCIQNILSLAGNRTVPAVDQYARGFDPRAMDQLGADLIALNDRAVRYRYPNHEHEPVATAIDWRMRVIPLAVAIKSLDCWLYQCAEGEEIENTLLYVRMKKLRDKACHAYVAAQEEYDQAEWG